jgi:hypothetical protein
MTEYVPLQDAGFDVADAFYRIRGSLPEERHLRPAGTNCAGFYRVKEDFTKQASEIEKQLKHGIISKRIARDKVVQKAYNAVKGFEKIGDDVKEKLRVLRALCNDMSIGSLYPSVVLDNQRLDIPDYLSGRQKTFVLANYDMVEKDDPRLVKETEKFVPIVKKVDGIFREYYTVYRELWTHMYRPRRRHAGDKLVPVLDEYESAFNEVTQPGCTRASDMAEDLEAIRAYNRITGAKWFMDGRFGAGTFYRLECLLNEKEKTLLLPKAAERLREIAATMRGLAQAGQSAYSDTNKEPT